MRRSSHNLSHEHKLSVDMGYLVPIATIEALPGDTFIHSTSLLARVAPLVNPVMHHVTIRVHHWFVPNRIIWDEWGEFIVGKTITGEYPTIPIPPLPDNYNLMDHMGLPDAIGHEVSALPIRAYNMIWNEYYRDQDLSVERDEDLVGLARISWEKDYFTTARHEAQIGDAVKIPFAAGTKAPIVGIGLQTPYNPTWDAGSVVRETGGGDATYTRAVTPGESQGEITFEEDPDNADNIGVYADLAAAAGAGIDITDLRQSMALQSFAEVRVRFGDRYVDYLRFLGINPGDTRMERPEFLGGGSQPINFSEVLATAEGATTKPGDLYGHGIAGMRSRRYRRSFKEHGWVLSLLSVRPKTVYMDGIPRKYARTDPMDYWQKELEVLPWQEVLNEEIYGKHATPEGRFGYVPKYDEYRQEQSYVSGSFRSGPEIDWHMGRKFVSEPTLNESFITCTPTDRIYGDTDMPELLINCRHRIKARRLVRKSAQFGSML